jgi:Na+/proline symporter
MTTTEARGEITSAARAVARCSPGSPRLLAEAAVLVGAACLLLHLVTAFDHHRQNVVVTVVVLAMAGACAACLPALWAGPTRRDWTVTGAMYAAMLLTHLCWLGFGPAPAVHAHGSELTWSELGMWGGLGLAGVQLCLAATGLMLPDDAPDMSESAPDARVGCHPDEQDDS